MSEPQATEEAEFQRLNGRKMTAADREAGNGIVKLLFFEPPDHPVKRRLFQKADSVVGFFRRSKKALG